MYAAISPPSVATQNTRDLIAPRHPLVASVVSKATKKLLHIATAENEGREALRFLTDSARARLDRRTPMHTWLASKKTPINCTLSRHPLLLLLLLHYSRAARVHALGFKPRSGGSKKPGRDSLAVQIPQKKKTWLPSLPAGSLAASLSTLPPCLPGALDSMDASEHMRTK